MKPSKPFGEAPTYLQRALKQDNTMPKWSNWSERLSHKPDSYQQIYSEQQAAALLHTANSRAKASEPSVPATATKIWWAMTASSWIWLVCRRPDSTEQGAWVWAGSRIHTLGLALHQHGLALPNQGDIDQQSIAGIQPPVPTAGASLSNLSSRVTGACIALATAV